jgi:protease-4
MVMLLLSLAPLSQACAQAPAKSAPKPVVAVFSLGGEILEAPQGEDLFLFGSPGGETLKDLVARMKKVCTDPQVKGVVLLTRGSGFRLAQVEELRQAIGQIKAAGKEVHAHADSLSTGSYGLLCGASSISVVPTGTVWISGMAGESPYLRGLLDMLGIQPDFFTCGAYKSAAEIFMRKGPSPEAQQMEDWLFDSMFETYVALVAKGRRVSPPLVRLWIDGAPYSAEKAKVLGIIDKVQYQEDFVAELKAKYGADVKWDKRYGKKDQMEGLDLSSPLGLIKLWAEMLQPARKPSKKDAVAIVYVDGPILPGQAGSNPFMSSGIAFSTPIRKALDEVAEDPSVKAVVLRVDSPGGSAVASEIILNATKRVKAKKPFAVSMGQVAGSGGYYVACGADTVFADSATITASIGVVSGKFVTTPMWKKVGIDWHTIKRGARADMLGSDHAFTPDERAALQGYMNEVYEVFKKHVTTIRGNRLKKKIDELAGGRVFTGQQALELGLVDKIGSLEDAIAHVAKQANLKEYEVRVVPRPKGFLEMLLSDLGERDGDSGTLSLAVRKDAIQQSKTLLDLAMPMLGGADPKRMEAIKLALMRLSLLQQERVVLMMPEMVLRLD